MKRVGAGFGVRYRIAVSIRGGIAIDSPVIMTSWFRETND